jgi:hypothetical protein
MKWLTIALQSFIALILLATGIGKLLDVPGFQSVLRSYQALPEWTIVPVSIGFVLVELRLAEYLIFGRNLRRAAMLSLLLHAAFTFWAVMTLLRGIEVPNCGCFGVFLARPLTWGTVGEDLFMVSISGLLWYLAGRHSINSGGRT